MPSHLTGGAYYRYVRELSEPCSDKRYNEVAANVQPFHFQVFYFTIKTLFSQERENIQNNFLGFFQRRQYSAKKAFFVNVIMPAIKQCIDENNSQASIDALQKKLKEGALAYSNTDVERIYEDAYFSLKKPNANFCWQPFDDESPIVLSEIQEPAAGILAFGYQGQQFYVTAATATTAAVRSSSAPSFVASPNNR